MLGSSWRLYPFSDQEHDIASSILGVNAILGAGGGTRRLEKGPASGRLLVVGIINDFDDKVFKSVAHGIPFDIERLGFPSLSDTAAIDAFFDPSRSTVFLKLKCVYDSEVLMQSVNAWSNEQDSDNGGDPQSWLFQRDVDVIKAMLFMFCVSHLVLLRSKTPSMDFAHLQLLRSVQSLKNGSISSLLSYFSTHPLRPPAVSVTLCPGKAVPVLVFMTDSSRPSAMDRRFRTLLSKFRLPVEPKLLPPGAVSAAAHGAGDSPTSYLFPYNIQSRLVQHAPTSPSSLPNHAILHFLPLFALHPRVCVISLYPSETERSSRSLDSVLNTPWIISVAMDKEHEISQRVGDSAKHQPRLPSFFSWYAGSKLFADWLGVPLVVEEHDSNEDDSNEGMDGSGKVSKTDDTLFAPLLALGTRHPPPPHPAPAARWSGALARSERIARRGLSAVDVIAIRQGALPLDPSMRFGLCSVLPHISSSGSSNPAIIEAVVERTKEVAAASSLSAPSGSGSAPSPSTTATAPFESIESCMCGLSQKRYHNCHRDGRGSRLTPVALLKSEDESPQDSESRLKFLSSFSFVPVQGLSSFDLTPSAAISQCVKVFRSKSTFTMFCRGPAAMYDSSLGMITPNCVPGFSTMVNCRLPILSQGSMMIVAKVASGVSSSSSSSSKSGQNTSQKQISIAEPLMPRLPVPLENEIGGVVSSQQQTQTQTQTISRRRKWMRVFVGIEYECMRGHVWISAKNSGNEYTASSFPLVMACPHCAAATAPNTPVVSRLMRLHMILPKTRAISLVCRPHVHFETPSSPTSSSSPTDEKKKSSQYEIGLESPKRLDSGKWWVCHFPSTWKFDDGCELSAGGMLKPEFVACAVSSQFSNKNNNG